MKIHLLLLLLFLCCSFLQAEVQFKKVTSDELPEFKDRLVTFYCEQLVLAGLAESVESIREMATFEFEEEPGEEYNYLQLASDDLSTPYGLLFYSIQDHTASLNAIYLEPQFRGQGFGKEALQKLEVELKNREIEAIRLYVYMFNQVALQLYNNLGYAVETTYSIGDTPIGCHMRKDL